MKKQQGKPGYQFIQPDHYLGEKSFIENVASMIEVLELQIEFIDFLYDVLGKVEEIELQRIPRG
tara:strand:+ start:1020 stop:1211 length:192 start_codon:yes stop_codon:yes gene_type:complete